MDLVALQENTGKLFNPFGFDFTTTWNKKPIVLRKLAPGQSITVIGPLRAHIAEMLYQKIRYQYHDEQVAKLKERNMDKDARRYQVPSTVEDKIWFMITGEALQRKKGKNAVEVQQEAADLTELENQLGQLDKKARGSGSPIDVISLVDKANEAALTAAAAERANPNRDPENDSTHTAGAVHVDGTPIEQKPIDTTPIDAADLSTTQPGNDGPADPDASPVQNAATTEFGELQELD